jgi:hypothetical protein
VLCFFIPFIDISPVLQRNEWAGHTAVAWIPVIGEYQAKETGVTALHNFFTTWNIVSLVVITGMLVMFLRILFQLISFQKMMKKAKAIPGKGMNLYQVDEEIIPFSFGNSIFINQHLHTTEELQEIIRHEIVHVKQKHSIDIIWGELLCLINWYNPFAWLLKRSIRQNLEFIADSKVLENGVNKKQYQYLLLKVIGNNQFSIAPKFNFSSLKKRIAMMNKLKTARLHLVRFLFILPVLAVILLSFRKQIGDSIAQDKNKETAIVISGDFTDTVPDVMELNDKGYYIDIKGKDGNCIVVVKDKNRKEVERVLLTKWNENEKYYVDKYGEIPPPPPPVPPVPPTPPNPPVPPVSKDDAVVKAFLKRNPDVKDIGRVYKNVNENTVVEVHIFKKDGTIEKYDLKVDADKAKVEKKYGKLPLTTEPPLPPLPPTKPIKAELDAIKGVNLSSISDKFEITENNATMKLKNGTIEKYNLKDPAERSVFENKYGRIISARTATPVDVSTVAVITGNSGKTVIAPVTPAVAADPARTLIVDDNGYIINGKEDILVTITKKTTPNQLEELKKQMKEKGIELKYENVDYNDGILVSISGTMKSKDVHGNFVATDFNKVTLSVVSNEDRTYFKVRVNDNKKIVM